jgi:hypothetical protein
MDGRAADAGAGDEFGFVQRGTGRQAHRDDVPLDQRICALGEAGGRWRGSAAAGIGYGVHARAALIGRPDAVIAGPPTARTIGG